MVLKILPVLSCNQHKNDDLGRLELDYHMNNAHISYKMPQDASGTHRKEISWVHHFAEYGVSRETWRRKVRTPAKSLK